MQEIALPGFKFQKFSAGVCPRAPSDSCEACRPHSYLPLIYYLTELVHFQPPPPPTGKSLEKALIKSRTKLYMWQTNAVPPKQD